MSDANSVASSRPIHSAWSPARLGALTLRNRLVMAPMVTMFPEVVDRPTDHHIEFYTKRARGGAGLVIVGATYVSPDGKGFPNQMGIDEHGKVPALRELAWRIQRHAPAILQLFHAGPKTSRSVSGREVVAPSVSIAHDARYDPARPLTDREVEELVTTFEFAAKRAHMAGFCGIEAHGANGYLVHAFSDSRSNRRTDGWRRLDAFSTELVRRLRSRLPASFLVGYTLSPFSIDSRDVADPWSLRAFVDLAGKLTVAGVDYIHVYRGKAEPRDCREPRVFAATLRQAGLTVPIVEGAGIRSAAQAEAFLRGGATLTAVGRALLGRPDLLADPGGEFPEADLATLSTSAGLRQAFASEYPRSAAHQEHRENGEASKSRDGPP